jgi:MinD-like ATPase involved in chromosome partitioning or flagellar assembly
LDKVNEQIILETVIGGTPRFLPVDIERLDPDQAEPALLRLRPSLARGKTVAYSAHFAVPDVSDISECPPVLTFHSLKGGMGRTTLALAFAGALADQHRQILFVDADFEAPGISITLKPIMPTPRVAFADLLALAHVDPDPGAEKTVDLVVERLADQNIDGITILPCTRDLGLPEILPDSLTFSASRSAFFVGDLLARVGKGVGADLVLVDLRAGLSELVAALFLDPRLQHVLVTTLNGQAIDVAKECR